MLLRELAKNIFDLLMRFIQFIDILPFDVLRFIHYIDFITKPLINSFLPKLSPQSNRDKPTLECKSLVTSSKHRPCHRKSSQWWFECTSSPMQRPDGPPESAKTCHKIAKFYIGWNSPPEHVSRFPFMSSTHNCLSPSNFSNQMIKFSV